MKLHNQTTLGLGLMLASCGATTGELDQGVARPKDETTFIESANAMIIAVDDSRVYWSTRGTRSSPARVHSCLKQDCASTITTYDTGDEQPQTQADPLLTVDSKSVYWTSMDGWAVTVRSCPIAGCDGTPATVATGVQVDSWVSDGTFLYWTSSADTAIVRCPVGGCGASPTAIALNQPMPGSIALGEPYLFWITGEYATTTLMRMGKDGAEPPQVFAGGQNQAAALATASGYVYWTNSYSVGTVMACPIEGCQDEPTQVAFNQRYPAPIVADSRQIYWALQEQSTFGVSGTSLVRCSRDGCGAQPTTIAEQQMMIDVWSPFPWSVLALDDQYLYWVTQGPVDMSNGEYVYAAIHRTAK